MWAGFSEYAGGGSSVDVLGFWRVASEVCWVCAGALFFFSPTMMKDVEDSGGVTESVVVSLRFVIRESLSWTEELHDVLVSSIL